MDMHDAYFYSSSYALEPMWEDGIYENSTCDTDGDDQPHAWGSYSKSKGNKTKEKINSFAGNTAEYENKEVQEMSEIKIENKLELYESVRNVPETALKPIQAGRLKGKSDINPMWRIKTLTETFGPCGFGWKYKIVNKHLEKGINEVSAFVDIELYVKWKGEWSEAIPGTGGSSFLANEKNGPYQSDECFKMALTDAISVACKALGVGADIYWGSDNTKYGVNTQPIQPQQQTQQSNQNKQESKSNLTDKQINRLWALAKAAKQNDKSIHEWIKKKFNKDSVKDLTKQEYDDICKALEANKSAA